MTHLCQRVQRAHFHRSIGIARLVRSISDRTRGVVLSAAESWQVSRWAVVSVAGFGSVPVDGATAQQGLYCSASMRVFLMRKKILHNCLNCGRSHRAERVGKRPHCYRSDYCQACNLKGDQACELLSQLFDHGQPRPDSAGEIFDARVEQYAAMVAAGQRLFEGQE